MHDEDQFKTEVKSTTLPYCDTAPLFGFQVRCRDILSSKGCTDAVVPVLQVHVPAERQEEFRGKKGFHDLVAPEPSTGVSQQQQQMLPETEMYRCRTPQLRFGHGARQSQPGRNYPKREICWP